MITTKKLKDLIISNPKIMMDNPVIKGTRVTVEIILRQLGGRGNINRYWLTIRNLLPGTFRQPSLFAADECTVG